MAIGDSDQARRWRAELENGRDPSNWIDIAEEYQKLLLLSLRPIPYRAWLNLDDSIIDQKCLALFAERLDEHEFHSSELRSRPGYDALFVGEIKLNELPGHLRS